MIPTGCIQVDELVMNQSIKPKKFLKNKTKRLRNKTKSG